MGKERMSGGRLVAEADRPAVSEPGRSGGLDRFARLELAGGGDGSGDSCQRAARRFVELDLLRGLVVVGMVIFHFFFILDFYGVKESAMFSGWWHVLGQFVRFTFLGLVGVGMVISYERVRRRMGGMERRGDAEKILRTATLFSMPLLSDAAIGAGRGAQCQLASLVAGLAIWRQWRRGLIVGIAAMAVTVGTYFYLGEEYYVRFGILHLIAVSIFFWSFFVEWKWVALVLSLVSFWLGGWFEWLGLDGLGEVGWSGIAYFLRASAANAGALDFFPIFPWIGIVGVGIFLGRILYSRGGSAVGRESTRNANWVLIVQLSHSLLSFLRSFLARLWFGKILIFLGKKALIIYLLHVPIIVGVLWVAGYVE